MKKLNVVFITGAGFSAEAGGPLISDFIEKARKIYRSSDYPLIRKTKEDYNNIDVAISELRSLYSKAYLDLNNIEALYGALEFGIMIDKFGSRKGNEIKNLRDSLIKLIVTTIELSIKYEFNSTTRRIFPSKVYKQFFQKLHSIKSQCNFSFITFNYDLILEIALESVSISYSYALNSNDLNDTYLLKLHGSLNWYDKGNTLSVEPLSNLQEGINFNVAENFLPVGLQIINSGRIPKIIPPTLNKFKYQEQLGLVWKKAAQVLSEAELVFIIGYSMPESDVFFKYLYALGIDSPVHLNKVVIINNNSSVHAAYHSLMGKIDEHRKFRFISGLFNQYVDTIFIEIQNLIS
jgi:hypothetical protein